MAMAHVRDVVIEKEGQLHLDDVPLKAGDRVQVVIIPKNGTTSAERYPLHGKPLRYDDPFSPACDPEDWEANQ